LVVFGFDKKSSPSSLVPKIDDDFVTVLLPADTEEEAKDEAAKEGLEAMGGAADDEASAPKRSSDFFPKDAEDVPAAAPNKSSLRIGPFVALPAVGFAGAKGSPNKEEEVEEDEAPVRSWVEAPGAGSGVGTAGFGAGAAALSGFGTAAEVVLFPGTTGGTTGRAGSAGAEVEAPNRPTPVDEVEVLVSPNKSVDAAFGAADKTD
jgi:hypothetical protein